MPISCSRVRLAPGLLALEAVFRIVAGDELGEVHLLGIVRQEVEEGDDQEATGTAGRIAHGLARLWTDALDDDLDQLTRRRLGACCRSPTPSPPVRLRGCGAGRMFERTSWSCFVFRQD